MIITLGLLKIVLKMYKIPKMRAKVCEICYNVQVKLYHYGVDYMGNTRKKGQKLKLRKWVIWVMAFLAVIIVGITAYIVSEALKAEENKDKVNVNVSDVELDNIGETVDNNIEKVQATVEIHLFDTAVQIGTRFMVTALVTPVNTEQALVWSSSNSDIFEVDSNGIITVKGVGTAVLTATVGNVSDAVVIEGIAKVTDGSANNLPIYNVSMNTGSGSGNSGNSGSGSTSNGSTSGGSTSGGSASSGSTSGGSASNGSTSGGSTSNGSTSGGSTSGGNTSSGNTSNGNTSSGSTSNGSTSNGSTSGGSTSNGSASGGNTSGGSTSNGSVSGGSASGGSTSGNVSTVIPGKEDGSGYDSTEIGAQLPGIGFDQSVSNLYVYKENGKYYGQIITQPNVTIVYVKERNDSFDAKIKSVLSALLPTENSQVWTNYVTSTTDRTFTVEGRMVRIVMASAVYGGHSQIVIYNQA